MATVARITEWWIYKFAPILAICFATALLAHHSIWAISGRLLLLLLALTVAATYVSLLNDWTDRADDLAAGKANRLARASVGRFTTLLGVCIATGAGFMVYFWHVGQAVCLLYLGTWVVYTLYSLPPFRLKGRGLAGVLADAAGAHFFPQLLATALVVCWTQQPWPPLWLATVGIWALASGLRNIIWHQLSDAVNDAQVGLSTFVTRNGTRRARLLAEWFLFPLEVLALLTLLFWAGHVAPVVALGLYGGLVLVRKRGWKMTLVIAQPGPNQHILLNEFYEVFYPVALLLTACYYYPTDVLALAGYIVLFGYSTLPKLRVMRDAANYVKHGLLARLPRVPS
ncbi:UbiA family prenyltransferase [Hymenobacter busanensis]|uniref:UbiA family prenyltransferase n=1 Tax=Hymenobacter busanensis TaxID=2607656 RepID=UPI0013675896|nr:UbiA family prenyltransferase [Hymenobacter busanensis]QHJ07963.1 hypothetical protein GUY19_11975 [Hymenobacter busanensis]